VTRHFMCSAWQRDDALVEPTGLGTVVHFETGGQFLKPFTTELPALKIGETAALSIKCENIRLFDPDTGARVRHSAA
jgi:multiple sugar transport system ATP-binding protein